MSKSNFNDFLAAEEFIYAFKGDDYVFGIDVLVQAGALAAQLGQRAILIRSTFKGSDEYVNTITQSLESMGVEIVATEHGAAPNAPREDLSRIRAAIEAADPDFVISFGGGSTIDAVKAGILLAGLGGSIEDFFGVGLVSKALKETEKSLLPHLAIQTAASSSAHLTKYSNITDLSTGQKKLVVDEAIVPQKALFDYAVTIGSPLSLTTDGALDGLSHSLEVLYSAVGKESYNQVEPVALETIRLVVNYLPETLNNPQGKNGRMALGLATDLGGYSIMLGGTNGGHLTSFSLVDIMPHGRACGLLNPYYTVFFAPAMTDALRKVAAIFKNAGFMDQKPDELEGRVLGLATAQAMIRFEKSIGFPTSLEEIPGFSQGHIKRALTAAKNPQLRMKLENMPVPMTAEMVETFMRPILEAAKTGEIEKVKNVR